MRAQIIRGVTLINGNGSPPLGPVDIVIEKNIIKSIKTVGYPGVEINERRRPKLNFIKSNEILNSFIYIFISVSLCIALAYLGFLTMNKIFN